MQRSLDSFRRKPDDMEKYIFLQGLLNRNEVLFYRLLGDNLTEMVPIVYTPTVGQACLELSHITRRYRGIYLSPENIANIDQIFQSVSLPSVNLIVVTDGERILGLGDLGSDGMGIPIGKVTLYVAAGGLHPALLPPDDAGCRHEQPAGCSKTRSTSAGSTRGWRATSTWDFIEKFVLGVRRNFPEALVQWEDFAKHKAFTLLERYRDRVLSFDDDIQGTGAVAASVLTTAMRIKKSRLADQRFGIVGMGQAGIGIATNVLALLRAEGLSEAEALQPHLHRRHAGPAVRGHARPLEVAAGRSPGAGRMSPAGRSNRATAST